MRETQTCSAFVVALFAAGSGFAQPAGRYLRKARDEAWARWHPLLNVLD